MLLEGIKITATDGTSEWIGVGQLDSVKLATPTGNSPFKAGRLTAYSLAGAAEVPVTAANGSNTIVEFGGYTNDGMFVACASNR